MFVTNNFWKAEKPIKCYHQNGVVHVYMHSQLVISETTTVLVEVESLEEALAQTISV